MPEIDLNQEFAAVLRHHHIDTVIEDEFISTDLPEEVKFKARVVYEVYETHTGSRLDVMAITNRGEKIIESCGDAGRTIEESVNNNFQNFAASTLHPLLVSLGCPDATSFAQTSFEDWEINGKIWKAHIGNLVPKMIAKNQEMIAPPYEFFEAMVQGIKAQKLTGRLHWFRGYYCQADGIITEKEFLMDNELVENAAEVFSAIPVLPDAVFYSCRMFIVLRDMNAL